MKKKIILQFKEIVELINRAKNDAFRAVNSEIIELYWEVGRYIHEKIRKAEWGEGPTNTLANYIKKNHTEIKGFNRRSLYRMRQFYDTYKTDKKVSALLTQLSWTNNLLILSKTKTIEEKGFYINLSIKEKYSSRELERQLDSCFYERAMLSKRSPVATRELSAVTKEFKDTYMLEFLNLPEEFREKDLRGALIKNFKAFVLELGKDFTFVGEEFKIQVGGNDYYIDILFFHRELRCLVAFELKITDFKPEYLGKLNFYLEALDRNVKKKHENPSVGVILCKNRDTEVVEYTLSRNMSPALISEYKTKLIDKEVLLEKLHEFSLMLKRR